MTRRERGPTLPREAGPTGLDKYQQNAAEIDARADRDWLRPPRYIPEMTWREAVLMVVLAVAVFCAVAGFALLAVRIFDWIQSL